MRLLFFLLTYPCSKLFSLLIGVPRCYHKNCYTIFQIPQHIKYCLIPGSLLRNPGQISSVLRERLDKAIEVAENRPGMIFILSGVGHQQMNGDIYIMREYLLTHSSISKEQLIMDDKGYRTFDSFVNLQHIDCHELMVITNHFHMPRALYIGTQLGYSVYGIQMPIIRNHYRFQYHLRESCACVKSWWLLTQYSFKKRN